MKIAWMPVLAALALVASVVYAVWVGADPEAVASTLATAGVGLAVLSLRDRS